MKKEVKNRARIAILNKVIGFCTNTLCDDGRISQPFDKNLGFKHVEHFTSNLPKNCLVRMMGVLGYSKFYLSWFRDFRMEDGWPQYLLESIEDNTLCWWENIGLYYLPLEVSNGCPHWQFTDAQFDFWEKLISIEHSMYSNIRIGIPVFYGNKVKMVFRKRYTDNNECVYVYADNFKKLRNKDIKRFITEASNYYN